MHYKLVLNAVFTSGGHFVLVQSDGGPRGLFSPDESDDEQQRLFVFGRGASKSDEREKRRQLGVGVEAAVETSHGQRRTSAADCARAKAFLFGLQVQWIALQLRERRQVKMLLST